MKPKHPYDFITTLPLLTHAVPKTTKGIKKMTAVIQQLHQTSFQWWKFELSFPRGMEKKRTGMKI